MFTNQLSILDVIEGERLRDQGISVAIDHADAVSPGWSQKAFEVLKQFLNQTNDSFMVEDVRSYAAEIDFDLPPSSRAWGGVIVRAANSGLVTRIGFGQVRNVKAHRANASIWLKT